MSVLLDGNVLVALSVRDHVHHDLVADWFVSEPRRFATTPMTQGTLLRFLLRAGLAAQGAITVLEAITRHEWHDLWLDDVPYDASMLRGVVGHRQVTDAYLAALARARGAWVATLDRGLAVLHPDVVVLIDLPSGLPAPSTRGGTAPGPGHPRR